jgi:2-keto-4-pentenoate hydratase/2-oxohepta-3-ene-1,7-dioic acid hydratase in catechol pathway
MRLARVRTPDGVATGEYDDGTVHTDEGSCAVDGEREGEEAGATLLAPCEPSALFCVGRNYAATLDQMDYDVPDAPDWFIKPPASVHPPGAPVPYPEWTEELTYAGELAAVIDRRCHEVAVEDVPSVVRGYTIMNDLDALDQPGRTARKAFDRSGPLGPWIETDVDPGDLSMTTDVGGERRQEATTAQMLFEPGEVIAFLSERYTFRPGDIVAFGSPANPGLVDPGEEVAIEYEGIGTLRNRVVAPGSADRDR